MSLLQLLLSAIGLVGGAGGAAALLTVVLQRRKFKADAADVLTDTALTLVAPLKERIRELEAEATRARREVASARREAASAREELAALRQVTAGMAATMTRWRDAIQDPRSDLDRLRLMVTDPPPNGPPKATFQ